MMRYIIISIEQFSTILIMVIKNSTNCKKNSFLFVVLEQKRDLERITVFEIALNDDRRDYQQDLPQNEHVKYSETKKKQQQH